MDGRAHIGQRRQTVGAAICLEPLERPADWFRQLDKAVGCRRSLLKRLKAKESERAVKVEPAGSNERSAREIKSNGGPRQNNELGSVQKR
jgi:hypothetical protein